MDDLPSVSTVTSWLKPRVLKAISLPRRATRRKWLRLSLGWMQGLHIFGAFGIASFGWAMGAALGWNAEPYTLLWFCGALLIYNLDRLRSDPADPLNTPRRIATHRQLRWLSVLVALVAVFGLIWIPIQRGDWFSLVAVILGTVICLAYSFPIYKRRRIKDVPLLKTFFPPTIVTLAVVFYPQIRAGIPTHPGTLLLAMMWAWTVLLSNMILCDVRDFRGDRRTGVISLPVFLGRARTQRVLWGLVACIAGLGFMLTLLPGPASRWLWALWAILVPLYLLALSLAVRVRRSERFYEWWVEGVLFLPAGIRLFFG